MPAERPVSSGTPPPPLQQQPAPSPLQQLQQLVSTGSQPLPGAVATTDPGVQHAPGATAALSDLLAGGSGVLGADAASAAAAVLPSTEQLAAPAEAMQIDEAQPLPALLLQQQLMRQQAAAAAAGGTLPWK